MKKALRENGKDLYQALHKGIKIPSYIADLLHSYTHGQTRINLDLHSTDDLNRTLYSVSRHLVTGVLIAALLISSSIICTTNMAPKILGIPGAWRSRIYSGICSDACFRCQVSSI